MSRTEMRIVDLKELAKPNREYVLVSREAVISEVIELIEEQYMADGQIAVSVLKSLYNEILYEMESLGLAELTTETP